MLVHLYEGSEQAVKETENRLLLGSEEREVRSGLMLSEGPESLGGDVVCSH